MSPTRNRRKLPLSRATERGAALILAIIVIFVLTVLGLGLLFTTTTEFRIAGAETTLNKTFYAADSGVQYAFLQSKQSLSYAGAGYTDPHTGTAYPNFWGFNLPEENPGPSAGLRSLSVRVTPFRQIDLARSPLHEFQQGAVVFYDIGFHLDSIASSQGFSSALNSQKQISVDFTVGPKPWTPAGQ